MYKFVALILAVLIYCVGFTFGQGHDILDYDQSGGVTGTDITGALKAGIDRYRQD